MFLSHQFHFYQTLNTRVGIDHGYKTQRHYKRLEVENNQLRNELNDIKILLIELVNQ